MGCAGVLAAERVPERREPDGAFGGALFADAFAGVLADALAGVLADALAGVSAAAFLGVFEDALAEGFAVVAGAFGGLFDEFGDRFAGAFAGPLPECPEDPPDESPEPLFGGSDPLLYSELASGGVAFMRACPRARRIHAMETPSR